MAFYPIQELRTRRIKGTPDGGLPTLTPLLLRADRGKLGTPAAHGEASRTPQMDSAARVQTLRAVQAIEYHDTLVARALLARLSRGAPGAWLTEEVRSALKRVHRIGGGPP